MLPERDINTGTCYYYRYYMLYRVQRKQIHKACEYRYSWAFQKNVYLCPVPQHRYPMARQCTGNVIIPCTGTLPVGTGTVPGMVRQLTGTLSCQYSR